MRQFIISIVSLFFAIPAIAGEHVVYQVGGQEYEGYWASAGEGAPVVLIVHDWDGLTDYEVKRAAMLNEKGYSVFAVDLFGKGIRPTETDEKKKLTGALYQDRAAMRARLNAGLEAAAGKGAAPENSVIAGYCFGGAAVLELARSGAELKGFVAFHGGLATPEGQDYSQAKGNYLILHGTADASVSMEDLAALGKALEENKRPHEIASYGGAPHAFTVFDSPRYREDADRKSWDRFLAFLNDNLRL